MGAETFFSVKAPPNLNWFERNVRDHSVIRKQNVGNHLTGSARRGLFLSTQRGFWPLILQISTILKQQTRNRVACGHEQWGRPEPSCRIWWVRRYCVVGYWSWSFSVWLFQRVLRSARRARGTRLLPRRPARHAMTDGILPLMEPAKARHSISISHLRAYYNCDSSTIRARHATTRYEDFRALAYEIDSSTPRESVVGVSCMLIDSSMYTIFTFYLYRPTLHRMCEYARKCLYKRN